MWSVNVAVFKWEGVFASCEWLFDNESFCSRIGFKSSAM